MARYIDADALKTKYSEKHYKGEITNEEYFYLVIPLDYAPTADVVERKKGEWIERSDGGRILYPWWESYKCNQCGHKGSGVWNFCPNCGAYMRGEEHE